LFVKIVPSAPATIRTLRAQLLRWFDPEDNAVNKLVITDDGTERPRYVDVICKSCSPYQIKGTASSVGFKVSLVVSGDVRWRLTSDVTTTWEITATGQTKVVPNAGEDDAYPVYNIMPTAPKAAGYTYRQWFPIKWRSPNSGYRYPIKAIRDTDALIGAAKMQADGDDLRILSDGVEIARWISDINTATTDIWFCLDFARAPTLALKTAIAGAGSIDSIEFTDEVEVSLLPDRGIIMIGTEAFVYTGRSLIDASVTGITREAKGTTIAAHNIADPCYWIQHDVYMAYGNAAAVAPVVNDNYMPCFELDLSTNTSWVYETFGKFGAFYAGGWYGTSNIMLVGGIGRYVTTERAEEVRGDKYPVMGIWKDYDVNTGAYWMAKWMLTNPCGIINAAWTNGKKRAEDITRFRCYCRYQIRNEAGWREQYVIPAPTVANVWEAWSKAAAAAWSEADEIELGLVGGYDSDVEIGDVTVTLSATDTPEITYGAEQGNYELDCTLTNNTTGEALYINFVMDEDTVLKIDTYNQVITWLKDNSRQYQSIAFSTNRTQMLKLLPGNNTLQFDDVGTDTVTITAVVTSRYY